MTPVAGSPDFSLSQHMLSQGDVKAPSVENVVPDACVSRHQECASALPSPDLTSRIVKPVLSSRNKKLIDLTQLPLDQLIAPDQHHAERFQLGLLEKARQRFFRHSCRQPASKPLKHDSELLDVARACNDINTLWPTLANLGKTFKEKLSDVARDALLDKHKHCPMKAFHDPRYCESEDFSSLEKFPAEIVEQLMVQQSIRVPSMPDWLCDAPPKKGHIIKKTLVEKLHAAGFDQVDPVIFMGGVPPVIAKPFASTQLFTEESGSSGTHHGKFSHMVAILALAESGKLTPAQLQQMLEKEGLWDVWLDTVIWTSLPQIKVTVEEQGRSEKVYFHGVAERLTCQAPENIHLLFLKKQLSEAVSNIRNQPDNVRKQAFLRAFLRAFKVDGQSSGCVDKALDELHDNLALLEACFIDSMYKGLYQNAGVHQFQLDDKAGYSSFSSSSKDISLRAKSYLSGGHCITGAGVDRSFKGATTTQKELKTEEDIDAFAKQHSRTHSSLSFIVEKKTPQKRTLEQASAPKVSIAEKKIRLSDPL